MRVGLEHERFCGAFFIIKIEQRTQKNTFTECVQFFVFAFGVKIPPCFLGLVKPFAIPGCGALFRQSRNPGRRLALSLIWPRQFVDRSMKRAWTTNYVSLIVRRAMIQEVQPVTDGHKDRYIVEP